MLTYESFLKWMAEGPKRAPYLYKQIDPKAKAAGDDEWDGIEEETKENT